MPTVSKLEHTCTVSSRLSRLLGAPSTSTAAALSSACRGSVLSVANPAGGWVGLVPPASSGTKPGASGGRGGCGGPADTVL